MQRLISRIYSAVVNVRNISYEVDDREVIDHGFALCCRDLFFGCVSTGCGRLLAGFLSTQPVSFELYIGNAFVSNVECPAGEIVLPYHGKYLLPFTFYSGPKQGMSVRNIVWHGTEGRIVSVHCCVHPKLADEYYSIMYVADDDKLYSFWKDGTWNSRQKLPNRKKFRLLEIPPMCGGARAITQRTSYICKELMAKAWHPNRMRRWCLEYDDEFAITDSAITDSFRCQASAV